MVNVARYTVTITGPDPIEFESSMWFDESNRRVMYDVVREIDDLETNLGDKLPDGYGVKIDAA